MFIEIGSQSHPAVLLVDDEVHILESLADLLRRDFRVLATDDVAKALELLQGTEIAVIITDQRMPKTTGSELLARAALVRPDTFRVLLTGYTDVQAVIQAVNEGRMYYYISKPWDPGKLLDLVRNAARHHQLLQENHRLVQQLGDAGGETGQASTASQDQGSRLANENEVLTTSLTRLVQSLEQLKAMQQVISTCMECGKIRTDSTKWEELRTYLTRHNVFLSHGYCPGCTEKVMKQMGL